MSAPTLAPGESIHIPSGTGDGRGMRLRRIPLGVVVIEHTCDNQTVEAVAFTEEAFNALLVAAADLR